MKSASCWTGESQGRTHGVKSIINLYAQRFAVIENERWLSYIFGAITHHCGAVDRVELQLVAFYPTIYSIRSTINSTFVLCCAVWVKASKQSWNDAVLHLEYRICMLALFYDAPLECRCRINFDSIKFKQPIYCIGAGEDESAILSHFNFLSLFSI